MAKWEYLLTDLSGAVVEPLPNAFTRKLDLPLRRTPTASFSLRMDDVAVQSLMGDRLVRIYRTGSAFGRQLMFNGPILSLEESVGAEGATVAVNAVGAIWRLGYRMIGKTKDTSESVKGGVTYTGTLSSIASSILADANADSPTGIQLGTADATPGSYTIGPIYFKSVGEAIAELGSTSLGYEFMVRPVEPTGAFPATIIGALDLRYPRIGTDNLGAVFEHGTSKGNVQSFQRIVSLDGVLTRGYNISSDFPSPSSSVLTANDATAQGFRGVYEGLVTSDLVDSGARQTLLDEHVAVRKDPRVIITFTPFRDATPEFMVDYAVGDTIRFRSVVQGVARIDVNLRVWGASVEIDSSGSEKTTLELVIP